MSYVLVRLNFLADRVMLSVHLLVRSSFIGDRPELTLLLAYRSRGAGFECAADALMIRPIIRRILAVLGIVGLVGSIGWYHWPLDFAKSEQAAVPAPHPAEAPVVAATPEPPPVRTETVELRRRDTVADLLKRSGLSLAEAHVLATGLREAGANLRRMRADDQLELARDVDERIVAVAYAPTAWQHFHASRTAADWTVERTDVTPEIRTEVREGEVRTSLWDVVGCLNKPRQDPSTLAGICSCGARPSLCA